jgi:hypothetical protein
VSRSTLLRLIRAAADPDDQVSIVVGVDDFALRKGKEAHAMGTALAARIPLVCSHRGRAAIAGLPGPGFLRDGGLLIGEFGIELAGECVQALVGPLDPAGTRVSLLWLA